MAYFPFDGDATDASGNGHIGTVVGSATLATDRFGNANQAYHFGGPAAYIAVPFDGGVFTNDFTASIWFNGHGQIADEIGDAALPSLPTFKAALWHKDKFVRERAGMLLLKLAPQAVPINQATLRRRPTLAPTG